MKRSIRTLLNGSRIGETKEVTSWSFDSKCPGKWLHVDCETGQVYARSGTLNAWKDPSLDLLKSAIIAIKKEIKRRC